MTATFCEARGEPQISTLKLKVTKGVALTLGQMSFHARSKVVWPNPLFPLINTDISELSEGEVWVFECLADTGLPLSIGSIPTMVPIPASWSWPGVLSQSYAARRFTTYLAAHTNLLRLDTALGPAVQFPRSS